MSRLPEITDLFARLASNLETLNPTATNEDQEAIDLSISHLNQSLNLEDSSRVRVLDTALSLMCFRAPQVFDSVIEYLVKTIVAVLSSSITCKTFRYGKAEFLRVGSGVSSRDCAGLIGACAAVLGKLEGHGLLSQSLLYAVVRVAVSASCFRFGLEITPILDVKSIEGGTPTVLKLLSHFPKDISFENQQIPLRSMAMNFPNWFYFALTVLFSGKSLHDNFHSEGTVEAAESEHSHDPELPCSTAAARYIAWVLSPTSESHQELLVECLAKISESWALKKCTDKHNKETSGYRKKLKKIKFQDKTDDCALLQEYDCKTIALWLGEFQDTYASQGNSLQQNVLFRRISLGILIGCSNGINEDGCQLLLHYAATGNFLPLTETQIAGLKHRNWNSQRQDDSTAWFEKCNIKEAVAGTCLVFHLTDDVESMSTSLFENEERGTDFICRVKIRARKYLLNCVKKLICIKIDEEDGFLMLRDLCSRLARWRHQGKDVFQGSKDLDDAVDALSHKLSSIQRVSASLKNA
ncbi:hypothetical protein Acr_12g0009900 [Actinidia rufa]|uniref:Uncharacterized protein n=1 Tax=Actinidia rufa TaxID=165716 RepID=A0A7J0FJV4_9ERIC|nr:hypothetical protein Acr_12g0009900 [Actinidia rufa]